MTNGSEGIAEYPGRPDYTALIEGLRKRHLRNPSGGGNVFTDAADALEALVAERDALGEHLDGMVEEIRASMVTIDGRGRITTRDKPVFRRRLVGPWTEMPEEGDRG